MKKYIAPIKSKEQIALDTIRGMFFHKHYNGVVPVKELNIVYNSSTWHNIYGKKEIKEAIKELKKDEYITLDDSKENWLWGGDMHDMLFPKDS
jgi:hypothetical protein